MHDFILWISGLFLGFWLGESYVRYQARKILERFMKDNMLEDNPKTHNYPIYFTEVENGIILLYNKNTNKFVCQGKTLEELAQNARKFKNVNRVIVHHDSTHFLFIDGEVITEVK
jgi:hypothetical protein